MAILRLEFIFVSSGILGYLFGKRSRIIVQAKLDFFWCADNSDGEHVVGNEGYIWILNPNFNV
jgi:hypothetical protein